MERKIIGIFVCTLLILTVVLPVEGLIDNSNQDSVWQIEIVDIEKTVDNLQNEKLKSDQIKKMTSINNVNLIDWGITEVVSTESNDQSQWPSLAVASDGTVHVVWMDVDDTNYGGSGSEYDIFYKSKPSGGSWSTTEVVSTESTGISCEALLAVASDGTVHVVWADSTNIGGAGTDTDIFYKSKPSGGSWSTTEVVSTESTMQSVWPSLAVASDGTLHVAWEDTTDYGGSGSEYDIFYKSKPSGGSWSTTEVVSTESTMNSLRTSLSVDSSETVHVAWEDSTNYGGSGSDKDIFYKSKPSGGSWSTTEVVSTESTKVSQWPSLAVASDGTLHVAWEDRTDYGGSGIYKDIFYKSKPSGGSWSTTEVVSTESATDALISSLTVDPSETVHVAWEDTTDYGGSGSDADIFYKSKPSGGSWSTTEVVSTESTMKSYRPSLAVASDGTLHVVWDDETDYDGSGSDADIFYKTELSGQHDIWCLLVASSDHQGSANDGDRYNNAIWEVYNALRNVGVASDHIRVYGSSYEAIGIGDSPPPANMSGAATLTNVNAGLDWLASTSTSSDYVFFCFMNHGVPEELCLSNGITETRMTSTQLNNKLNAISYDKAIILLGQCFSGSFITNNDGSISASNRIVITCVNDILPGFSMELPPNLDPDDGVSYDPTLRYFAQAIRGEGDTNDDGVVTMKEAFDYVKNEESTDGLPTIDSGRDRGWLDDNGDQNVNSNDGLVAATVSLGPYGGDPFFLSCNISSNVDGTVFPSNDVSFEITVRNNGGVDLNGGNLRFIIGQLENGDRNFTCLEKQTHSINLGSGQSTNIPVSWEAPNAGNFSILIDLIKDGDYLDNKIYDFTTLDGGENEPPNKPTCGYDKTRDELVVSTTDPDGNQVKYGISWNNDGNVDQWTTFYDSGVESKINCEGRKGTVGVIAEDEHGAQSDWVSATPKNKSINTPFIRFLEDHPRMFPLLRQLLELK